MIPLKQTLIAALTGLSLGGWSLSAVAQDAARAQVQVRVQVNDDGAVPYVYTNPLDYTAPVTVVPAAPVAVVPAAPVAVVPVFPAQTVVVSQERAALGLTLANTDGTVEVASVVPDSPGHRAGVLPGDQLVCLNGVAYRTPSGYAAAVSQLPPGATARIELLRDGEAMTASARLEPWDVAFNPGTESDTMIASRPLERRQMVMRPNFDAVERPRDVEAEVNAIDDELNRLERRIIELREMRAEIGEAQIAPAPERVEVIEPEVEIIEEPSAVPATSSVDPGTPVDTVPAPADGTILEEADDRDLELNDLDDDDDVEIDRVEIEADGEIDD